MRVFDLVIKPVHDRQKWQSKHVGESARTYIAYVVNRNKSHDLLWLKFLYRKLSIERNTMNGNNNVKKRFLSNK